MYVPQINPFVGFQRIFIEGYLEILISACLMYMGMDQIYIDSNRSDQICLFVLCATTGILLFAPVYMLIKIRKHFDELDSPKIQHQYGLFYTDLSTETIYKAVFNVIFITRRIIFVVILMSLSTVPNIQLLVFMNFTTIYIIYIAQHNPYEERSQNHFEVFNEVCVMINCYVQ